MVKRRADKSVKKIVLGKLKDTDKLDRKYLQGEVRIELDQLGERFL